MRGGTSALLCPRRFAIHFNPPAPCGAGLLFVYSCSTMLSFQSTRPVRGGTVFHKHSGMLFGISIHPPRAGRDTHAAFKPTGHILFQSTRPVRGGTLVICGIPCTIPISIHPPRAGRDFLIAWIGKRIIKFQSTRPVRGGTFSVPCGIING